MLIKLQDFDDKTAEHLKNITGHNTASGAVRYVAERYMSDVSERAEFRERNAYLQSEVARLFQIIENARAAAAALLDKTSQGDLL